jgi:pimeloyl-ACP methyl ester carboxylesterase
VSQPCHVDFDGHRLVYRVSGEGPALVVLNLYRRRDLMQSRVLSHQWQVFELCPLGYGYSDRVPGYAGELLVPQVHAVLDEHGVDRFIVWGFSAGGAMAACIARDSSRAAGLVCGAYSLVGQPSDATMRRLDRRLPPNNAARTLWPWVKHFDWAEELGRMPCPVLLYWGSEDGHQAKGLRRTQQLLLTNEVDCVEYPGLGHDVGGDPTLLAEFVIPTVVDWVARRVGATW